MIGDSETDVMAGRAAGCLTVYVGPAAKASSADFVAEDLAAAWALLRARER